MKKRIRNALAALASGALLAVGLGAANPAHATITTMYTFDYEMNSPLYTVDPTTGAATAVGSGITDLRTIGAVWNPNDDTITAVMWSIGLSQCQLWSVDPLTGTGSIALVLDETNFDIHNCSNVAYGVDGTLYVGAVLVSDNKTHIFTVDGSTGVILDDIYGRVDDSGSFDFMVVDFRDGLIYFQPDGGSQDLLSFDPVTSTETLIATGTDFPFYGSAISADGVIYVNLWGQLATMDGWSDFPNYTTIGNTTPASNSSTILFEQEFPAPKPNPSPESELPATGTDSTLLGVIGFGALTVITFGAIMVARRRKA